MNQFFEKTKKIYLKLITRQESYKRDGIEPSWDWSLILVFNFILFCVAGLFGYYVFVQIKNDQLFSTESTNTLNEVKINRNLLEKTIEDIRIREENTIYLKTNGVNSVDPSR